MEGEEGREGRSGRVVSAIDQRSVAITCMGHNSRCPSRADHGAHGAHGDCG